MSAKDEMDGWQINDGVQATEIQTIPTTRKDRRDEFIKSEVNLFIKN